MHVQHGVLRHPTARESADARFTKCVADELLPHPCSAPM